ncbi:MAG TPA: hypothetical protein VE993_02870, partial [Stellaceae bacterium]|nr:hypothetical protein [Stellaceae bacterium]
SGAPVIDGSGFLVGMVVGRLADRSDLGILATAGEINEFLSRGGVAPLARGTTVARAEDLSGAIARISALVQCRSAAEIRDLIMPHGF